MLQPLIALVLGMLVLVSCGQEAKKGTALIQVGDKFYRASDLKAASDKNLSISQVKDITMPEEVRGIRAAYGYNSGNPAANWDYYYGQSPYQNYYYSYTPTYYNPSNFCGGWGFSSSWCMNNIYPSNYNQSQWSNYWGNSSGCGYFGYNYYGNMYGQNPGCSYGSTWWYY